MESERKLNKKRTIIFITITFAITWFVFSLVPICGLAYGSGYSILIVAGAMFVPALGSILTRLITKEGFQNMMLRPYLKQNWKWYLLLFFGPTAMILLSSLIYFLLFPASFDPAFSTLRSALAASKNVSLSPEIMLLIVMLQMIFLGPVINLIPTLGEELGWRGYLLPKLRMFFSDRTALLFSGAIWGLWHLPVIAMGHNYGTEYVGYPFLGIFAMVVFCIVLGIIEGYASIRMNSAIPAAMIHSAVNAGAGLPLYFIKGTYNPILGPAITGLLGGIPFILLAIFLFIRINKRSQSS